MGPSHSLIKEDEEGENGCDDNEIAHMDFVGSTGSRVKGYFVSSPSLISTLYRSSRFGWVRESS